MRKIGVVTTSRADYGIYFPVLQKLQACPQIQLQVYVTGSHLSKDFGFTVEQIRQDGFPITAEVPVALADRPVDIGRVMGEVTIGFAKVYNQYRPDIVLFLGDRYEMHAAAVAAIPFGIPLAHIHGGELTYGAIDELFRHSLTKMSHLHFTATETYANRIRQMGEEPWRITVSGAPGLDNLIASQLPSREQLAERFGLDLSCDPILVTFHPVTRDLKKNEGYVQNLLAALGEFCNDNIVFTHPNADTEHQVIVKAIKAFLHERSKACLIDNFGTQGYWGIMKIAKVMVGNSSSGVIEAASFQLPVVNIGTRQEGRIRVRNVIDVDYDQQAISQGIRKALSDYFRHSLQGLQNPYGDGHAAQRIVSVLAGVDLATLRDKKFYDF
jgi:UDP-hydrolysing UDP-N-acetyl-D-glucosamine 2-epimerase